MNAADSAIFFLGSVGVSFVFFLANFLSNEGVDMVPSLMKLYNTTIYI
jgi:hypothetical protein